MNDLVSLSQVSPYAIKSAELDRRAKLADALTQQAYTAPEPGSYNGIQAPISPIQGITKLLQMGLAGYQNKEINEERKQAYDDMQTTRRKALVDALNGSNAKPWVNPDTGETSTAPAGGSGGMLASLMLSTDPELQSLGLRQKIEQDRSDRDLAARREDTKANQAFTLSRDAVQNNYQTTAAALQRAHQEFMADKSEANQLALQKAQQEFTAAQNAASQAFQQAQQGRQQTFTGDQNQMNRDLEMQKLNAKPMTDEQAKAAGFSDRMVQAMGQIDQFGQAGTSYSDTMKGSIPVVGNAMVSPEYQQLDQAKRNFVNAVLRRESGAAVSPSEFENANKQYFPQPGDTPQTLEQKALNRKTALEGMARSAGPSYKLPEAKGAPAALSPQDKEALDWATANPNDPRAAAIKQRLGK